MTGPLDPRHAGRLHERADLERELPDDLLAELDGLAVRVDGRPELRELPPDPLYGLIDFAREVLVPRRDGAPTEAERAAAQHDLDATFHAIDALLARRIAAMPDGPPRWWRA